MKDRDITIYDIAKELNLSVATVSRALNNIKGTNEETSKLVKVAAEKLGYRPNANATSLRISKSKTVGLIVPRISMYFHSIVISEIQDKAHEKGYNLIISQSNDNLILEKELIDTMFNSRVDGLIMSITMFTRDYTVFDIFLKKHIPIVFYDRVPMNISVPVVEGDDYRGGYIATEHLIKKGCKRIANFAGPLTSNIYKNRFNGYRDALMQNDIEFSDELVIEHMLTTTTAIEASNKLFSLKKLPDGLVSANDTSAIAAVRKAKEVGISVPEQFRVVGYSNNPSTELMTPSISSIDQSAADMGNLTFETLFNMMSKERRVIPQKQIIGIQLIERDSSR